MHRGWFKQRIMLSGAWSVLVPSARVAGSLCSVCKLSGGCSVPWAFGKGRDVSGCPQAEAPLEEADPGCVMSSRGLWPCRGGWYPVSCCALSLWSVLILRQARPIGSCPSLSAVLPLQPVLPNPLFSVRSPLFLPFPPSSSSPCLPSSLFRSYSSISISSSLFQQNDINQGDR